MAREARKIQDALSDDDAPEVVSHSTSKADAKRNQKALHDFELEERARRKTRNREKDQKLKERARVTKGGKVSKKVKGGQLLKGESEEDSGEDEGVDDDVEARMRRAMRDAAGEVESVEEEMDNDESEDDEEMEEDEEDDKTVPFNGNIPRSNRKTDYLADDLFAAAFASQNSKPVLEKKTESTQQQAVKKRRRKSTEHPKDLVIGGRTIRTLLRPSDPRSQATARSVPSARACEFMDHSLAMKGKKALLNAREKGWERRPANVGVMKYQGAPYGFARSTVKRLESHHLSASMVDETSQHQY